MDNKEEVLNALEDYGRKPSENIPQILEDYLRHIAKTGVTMFPWAKLKPLFEQRLDQAMKEFHSRVPMEHLPSSPNVENVTFDNMRERLLESVKTFTGAPFTIQRLCELVTNPSKHYQRTDKYLRGIEKNVLVVSTVDPFGRKIVNESSQMMVNGMESNNSVNNKPVAETSSGEKVSGSPFVPPVPSNSPVASSDWFSSHTANVDSPSRFGAWGSSSQAQQSQQSLQAMGKVTDPTSSSQEAGSSLGQPVWDTNISDMASGDMASTAAGSKPSDLDPLQAAEGVLSDIEKGAADNVSSSSDSSTNESSLSDLSNDSEAEYTTKSGSLETHISEGERDSLPQQLEDTGSQIDSGEQAVTTSEEDMKAADGEKTGVKDEESEEMKAAADISTGEMGQGDATCSSADDIELRRSSGGFETTKGVTSIMSSGGDDDTEQEPLAKKARLECQDSDLDLSSTSSSHSCVMEEPSQSVTRKEEEEGERDLGEKEEEEGGVGSSEGVVSGSQDSDMSSSSDVEHSSSSSTVSGGEQLASSTLPAPSADTEVHSSLPSSPTHDTNVVTCNSSSSSTEACSQSTVSSGQHATHTDEQTDSSQCDSVSGPLSDSDQQQQQQTQQQPPDSAGPEPMDTD